MSRQQIHRHIENAVNCYPDVIVSLESSENRSFELRNANPNMRIPLSKPDPGMYRVSGGRMAPRQCHNECATLIQPADNFNGSIVKFNGTLGNGKP